MVYREPEKWSPLPVMGLLPKNHRGGLQRSARLAMGFELDGVILAATFNPGYCRQGWGDFR
jgi:hypothetical protein